jgi:hypothetical protein
LFSARIYIKLIVLSIPKTQFSFNIYFSFTSYLKQKIFLKQNKSLFFLNLYASRIRIKKIIFNRAERERERECMKKYLKKKQEIIFKFLLIFFFYDSRLYYYMQTTNLIRRFIYANRRQSLFSYFNLIIF